MANQRNSSQIDEPPLELIALRAEEEREPFDAQQLAERLARDIGIATELAHKIALEVQQLLRQTGLRQIPPSLIRGLVETKLLEYGFDQEYRNAIHLGLPLREVERLAQQFDRPRNTSSLDARATSQALGNIIKRDYALLATYCEPVAEAHLNGDINIEQVEAVDSLYSLFLSPDYIKRAGALLRPGMAALRPPRNAREFITHLVQSSGSLARCLSGPLSWDSLNFALAPLIGNADDREMKEIAEEVVRQFNAIDENCEIVLDWQAPDYLAERNALAADGSELPNKYRDYSQTARRLLIAMLEIYLSGDQIGLPLLKPKPIIYLPAAGNEPVSDTGAIEIFHRLMRERGQIQFRFTRIGQPAFNQRYGLAMSAAMQTGNWEWRVASFQAVAINLPRAAFRASGDPVRVFETLTEMLDIAAQAHLEKRIYLEKLLAQGEHGPLALLARRRHGSALLKLNRALHWLCPIGLNEMTRATVGKNLYDDEPALEFGKQICQYLAKETIRLSAKHKVNFLLAHLNNIESARRFARLDLRHYGEAAAQYLPPVGDSDELSYTLGIGLPHSAALPPAPRIKLEAALQADLFHQAATTWRVSANPPPYPDESKEWLKAALAEPGQAGLNIQLHFALCLDCHSVLRGAPSNCSVCQSALIRQYV